MNKNIIIKSSPIIILIVAIIIAAVMIKSRKPPPQRPAEPVAMLVDARPAVRQNVNFEVHTQGNVTPKFNTSVSPQVNGTVITLSEKFVVGGLVNKGDLLIKLDDADYRTDLQLAEAELARAQAALDEEIARAKVAEEEWRSIKNTVAPELGLRKPQLAREQANLKAAEAQLERAKRNLERTEIRAPFNAIIMQKNTDLGQFVTAGTNIARLYSIDTAEVRLPITESELAYINVNDHASLQNYSVELRGSIAGKSHFWQGRLVRTEGVVDTTSRVLYAVIEVEQPYVVSGERTQPLRFGQFVQASVIDNESVPLFALPRSVVRLDNTVLTVDDDNKITIKPINVIRSTRDYIFADEGLNNGELVVHSAVPNPYDGMQVRLLGDEPLPAPAERDQAEPDGELAGAESDE